MADPDNVADPLAGLFGVRLPPDAPFQAIADLSAAAGLGVLAALLIAPLIGRVTQRKARAPTLDEQIDALAQQPVELRVPALLMLLKKHAPDRARAYGVTLYQPGALPDPAEVEQLLREAR